MRYQNILLDFDGTVAQSGNGIINGVRFACETMGLTEGSPWENWCAYIGPTVYRYTTEVLGLDEAGRERFMGLYLQYYKQKGLYESPLYNGIAELIKDLRAAGCGVYIASSKPRELTLLSIDYLGLEFDGIVAAIPERNGKREVIAYCLEHYGLDPSASVMVGDRDGDILGGRANGTATVGVSYGYGTREELESAGADFVADSVEELRDWLLG